METIKVSLKVNFSIFTMFWIMLISLFFAFTSERVTATDIPPKGNTQIESLSEAKKMLTSIYSSRRISFYCGCSYGWNLKTEHTSCGFKSKQPINKERNNNQAFRIEWKNVVPTDMFGKSFKEWKECQVKKDRKCVQTYQHFAYMESDLYNFVPVIAELTGNRGDYSMTIISGEAREYGSCDIEINGEELEPDEDIRGDIARTYFYMDWAYPGLEIVSKKIEECLKNGTKQIQLMIGNVEELGKS
jgi:deoxyribonuclease I